MQNSKLWAIVDVRKLILITKVKGTPIIAPELFLWFGEVSLA